MSQPRPPTPSPTGPAPGHTSAAARCCQPASPATAVRPRPRRRRAGRQEQRLSSREAEVRVQDGQAAGHVAASTAPPDPAPRDGCQLPARAGSSGAGSRGGPGGREGRGDRPRIQAAARTGAGRASAGWSGPGSNRAGSARRPRVDHSRTGRGRPGTAGRPGRCTCAASTDAEAHAASEAGDRAALRAAPRPAGSMRWTRRSAGTRDPALASRSGRGEPNLRGGRPRGLPDHRQVETTASRPASALSSAVAADGESRVSRGLPREAAADLLLAALQDLDGVPANGAQSLAAGGRRCRPGCRDHAQAAPPRPTAARCAALLPRGSPLDRQLALIEVGASAGLCLYPAATATTTTATP